MIRGLTLAALLTACSGPSLPEATGGGAPTGAGVGGESQGGAPPLDCSDLDGACGVGVVEHGACVRRALADGTPCDDGSGCTLGDRCEGGACAPGTPVECASPDVCHAAACDAATGLCVVTTANDGAPCLSGDACVVSEVCAGGTCGGGAPRECLASDFCREAACDPAFGCYEFSAHLGEECAPPEACRIFTCVDGGYCAFTPVNEGGACDDGNACRFGDACVGGDCVGTDEPFGTPCDDGFACTSGEVCDAGWCHFGVTTCPAPASECVMSDCDFPLGACAGFVLSGNPCEHPGACRGAGICDVGSCAGATPENDGAACDDGSACTSGDTCGAGDCVGAPITACVAGDGCCPGGCTEATDGDCAVRVYMASTQGLPGFFAFDVASEVWTTLPEPGSPIRSSLATDGHAVFAVGEDLQVHRYEPATATWSPLAPAPAPIGLPPPPTGGYVLSANAAGLFVHARGTYEAHRRLGVDWVKVAPSGFYAAMSLESGTDRLWARSTYGLDVSFFDPGLSSTPWAYDNLEPVEPSSRFGAFVNGAFYATYDPPSSLLVKVFEGSANRQLLGFGTADPNPSSALDEATATVYIGPSGSSAAFQALDAAADVLLDLPSPPPIPDGYLSSLVVLRAPSTP